MSRLLAHPRAKLHVYEFRQFSKTRRSPPQYGVAPRYGFVVTHVERFDNALFFVVALFYAAATVHSAIRYWRGRGG